MSKTKLIARSIDATASVRKESDGKNYLEFYPVVFDKRSKLISEYGETFYEIISRNALDEILQNPDLNCLATVDHDREKILGRNKSNTLILTPDSKGLKATVELPDTTLGRDMAVLIDRGDYFESSFIYTLAKNGVTYDRTESIPVRTVTNIRNLYDVSIVLDGAFSETSVKKRSAEIYGDDEAEDDNEIKQDENNFISKSDSDAQRNLELETLNLELQNSDNDLILLSQSKLALTAKL